ncbi:MAG: hypothetical protein ABIH11_02305 [Candidatus Altiarchaeota archaeon]
MLDDEKEDERSPPYRDGSGGGKRANRGKYCGGEGEETGRYRD